MARRQTNSHGNGALRYLLLRQTVQAIMKGDFSHRLPVQQGSRQGDDGRTDELNTLSVTINGMLEQIEQLVHGVRDVSNAIAHDLRTPLAELRSRLEELSLTRPDRRKRPSRRSKRRVADVDRVIRIFNALLRLAEIDSGMRRSGFVQINASGAGPSRRRTSINPPRNSRAWALAFRAPRGGVMISGDPVLLAQAIGNLIDNALKYTPEGGAIAVAVQPHGEGI